MILAFLGLGIGEFASELLNYVEMSRLERDRILCFRFRGSVFTDFLKELIGQLFRESKIVMKLEKSKILLINTVVGLVGVILVLLSVNAENNPKLKTMLEAIGTSLIVSGGVNFLDKLLDQEIKEQNSPIETVTIKTHKRNNIGQDVHEGKYKAKKVDIVGISLSQCLQEIVDDPRQRMINRLVRGETERLRLLFIHPNAPFIKQRALEDGIKPEKLENQQKESIKLCIEFYKKLKNRLDKAKSDGDSYDAKSYVEIRLIDLCPHITLERFDNETYWGLYMAHSVGLNSPMFKITKEQNDELFEQLKNHFKELTTKKLNPNNNNVLLQMTMGHLYFNIPLAESIFGADELEKLLPLKYR